MGLVSFNLVTISYLHIPWGLDPCSYKHYDRHTHIHTSSVFNEGDANSWTLIETELCPPLLLLLKVSSLSCEADSSCKLAAAAATLPTPSYGGTQND